MEPDKIKILTQIGISVLVLGSALFVILYTGSQLSGWHSAIAGAIVGYWFR